MAIKTPEVPRAHWDGICRRYEGGDTLTAIARDHGVKPNKIKKILEELNAYERVKPQPKKVRRPSTGKTLKDFTSAARSILWRQDQGGEHPVFKSWEDRIAELASDEGGGLAKGQAIVQASKDFKCLRKLFREHNVSEYDPHPESHPGIQKWGDKKKEDNSAEENVAFEGIESNYRENLRWAMEAVGSYLNTRKHPVTTPNGTAWFFYRQAIDEPKDFMAKYGQMEAKADDGGDDLRRETRKSVDEIHSFLNELEGEKNAPNS